MGSYLSQRTAIVGALAPVDKAGGAIASKPINLASGRRVAFLVYFGSVNSTGVLTVEKGTANTLGTAIAFNYKVASTGAAAFSVLDADFATQAAATGLTLGTTPAAPSNKILVIEINSEELGGSNWVGVKIAASGSTNLISIIALVSEDRWPQAIPKDPTS